MTSYNAGISKDNTVFGKLDDPTASSWDRIDAAPDENTRDEYGQAALFGADAAATQALIEDGADVHIRNALGQTPLFSAHPETVKILAAAGANLDHRDKEGKTVLSCAVCGFFDELDYIGRSITLASLFSPSMLSKQKKVSVLLQQGANPHSQSAEADTETAAAMIETRYLPYKKTLLQPVDNAQHAGHRAAAAGGLDAIAAAYLWNQRGEAIKKQSVAHGGKLGAATGIAASYCSDPASFRAIADALQIAQQREDNEKEAPSTGFRVKEDDRDKDGHRNALTL